MSSSIPNGGPGAGPKLRSIIVININLFFAACLAALAWFFWPETAEGWRLGLLSIFCGYAAFILAYRGIDQAWQHIKHDIGVGRFQDTARKPRSDKLAGDDALGRSDMFE